jgi:hypothetical protein
MRAQQESLELKLTLAQAQQASLASQSADRQALFVSQSADQLANFESKLLKIVDEKVSVFLSTTYPSVAQEE